MSEATPGADAFPTTELDATEDDGSDALGEATGSVDAAPDVARDADDVS